MSKIPNWTRKNSGFATWIHDVTGDEISIGPAQRTEFRKDGNPKKYQITKWSRCGRNNIVIPKTYRSLEKAKKRAIGIARENPKGQLVKSMYEKIIILNGVKENQRFKSKDLY